MDQFVLNDDRSNETTARTDRMDLIEDGLASGSLTKAELAEMLFDSLGLNKREAKDFVDAFFDEIRTTLEGGDSVKLSGFGNFQLRDKPQRPGRNPKTGEEIPIAARRVVTFHPSQKLKALVE
ncbi:MAG: integration host factor subunit alpha [Gammaproteobacteria bacterium]|uniref:Integration host factor subunit alpha n=2 Tax=Burkholderiaceae TaxID=119060 RepID=A0ABX6N4R5_9BURK|nr:integration host factor subunit alpha [Sutterellaceae bacterium]MBA4315206.1 integration host factor subunit alpha [Alcaligenaceae bacterium]MBU0541503.1 integration host factor subunit alpha [Gammaproteobacteria bacterium]PQJ25520.1 integration host factor subunit alpha [Limnobacter sp. SAORIC-690]QJR29385.1 integration host factor subunit alpha [Limnobacter sp. SAORIC-580]RZO92719.1 MAG: integration host factor subunit alpha [Limnobacter sp.]